MKIISYNINGIRASSAKGLLNWIDQIDADILCFQEIRAKEEVARQLFHTNSEQLSLFDSDLFLNKYHIVYNCGQVPGYAGTAILTKKKPTSIIYGLPSQTTDVEGRTITLLFDNLAILNCYVPNGGSRLDYKFDFFHELNEYLTELEKKYTVIFCSDSNIAHTELDVSSPKYAEKRTGFLPSERKLLDTLFSRGYVDIVRQEKKEEKTYTWRSYQSQKVKDDIGIKYRFDYIATTKNIANKVVGCEIQDLIYSDHLPIIVTLDIR